MRDLEKKATQIADAIVALVEATDGPVSLCQVGREIRDFAKEEPPWWDYHIGSDIYWGKMTKAGSGALEKVIGGHRVAIQFVSPLDYLIFEKEVLDHPDWQPILLLPARAANVYSRNALVRGSERFLAVARMNPKCQLLTPKPVRCTADAFSL
jgi:hypothetical protein